MRNPLRNLQRVRTAPWVPVLCTPPIQKWEPQRSLVFQLFA